MLVAPRRNHRAPRTVDLPAVFGLNGNTRASIRAIDVQRGVSGASRLAALSCSGIVIDGVLMRTIRLGRRVSAALYGPGDLVPHAGQEPPPFETRLRALTKARYAPLDEPAMAAIATQPELTVALSARMSRHNDELVLQSVLTQLVSIEERLEVLLPRLAERWGTVGPNGVLLPSFLSHTILAALVGVRRPSLTTAIAGLARDGLFTRQPDRRWLVSPELAGLAAAA
jgi:CRP/FNR family transcriptional regulator, cyclic AMP receptor protein